jgi:hypothetical protein
MGGRVPSRAPLAQVSRAVESIWAGSGFEDEDSDTDFAADVVTTIAAFDPRAL